MHEDSKIEEAEFFLKQIAGAADRPKETRYYTGAFLVAARSALQYAHKEVRNNKDGRAWYDAAITADPLAKFLKERRDTDIHDQPLPVQTNITIQLRGVVAYSNPSVEPPQPPEDLPTTTYDYRFRGWTGGEDVHTLCGRYLEEIKRIVADGREKGFLTR